MNRYAMCVAAGVVSFPVLEAALNRPMPSLLGEVVLGLAVSGAMPLIFALLFCSTGWLSGVRGRESDTSLPIRLRDLWLDAGSRLDDGSFGVESSRSASGRSVRVKWRTEGFAIAFYLAVSVILRGIVDSPRHGLARDVSLSVVLYVVVYGTVVLVRKAEQKSSAVDE